MPHRAAIGGDTAGDGRGQTAKTIAGIVEQHHPPVEPLVVPEEDTDRAPACAAGALVQGMAGVAMQLVAEDAESGSFSELHKMPPPLSSGWQKPRWIQSFVQRDWIRTEAELQRPARHTARRRTRHCVSGSTYADLWTKLDESMACTPDMHPARWLAYYRVSTDRQVSPAWALKPNGRRWRRWPTSGAR